MRGEAFTEQYGPQKSNDLRGRYEQELNTGPKKGKIKPHGKLKPVMEKGKVKVKKHSLLKKFGDVFIATDPETVREQVFNDIFVPSIQDMLMDMAWGGLSMLFYNGSPRGGRRRRGRGYHDIYEERQRGGSKITRESDRNDIQVRSNRIGTSRLIDQLEFDEYSDAKKLFQEIMDAMEEYGVVSIADVLDLCEHDHTYADNYWGWTNLSSMSIKSIGGAFTIIFPRAKDISNFVGKVEEEEG